MDSVIKIRLFSSSMCLLLCATVHAHGLPSYSDARLCASIGLAASNNDRARLNRLEAEGARRDRLHLTRLPQGECERIAREAVEQKMQPQLDDAHKKLNAALQQLESKRNQSEDPE